jgi:DNA gyrase subunit A
MKVIGSQDSLDKAISIIRHSANPQAAKEGLIEALNFQKFRLRQFLIYDCSSYRNGA